MLGLIVGVLVAFGVEYFRETSDQPKTEEGNAAAVAEDRAEDADKY